MNRIDASDLANLLAGSVSISTIAEKYALPEAEVEAQRTHAREVLGALLTTKPRGRRGAVVLAAAVVALFALGAVAQGMCTMSDGLCVFVADTPAQASEVNYNFQVLNDRIRQTAQRAGVTAYVTDGGVPPPGAITVASVTVAGSTTLGGSTTLTGSATIAGTATIAGQLATGGGVAPNWDSGWVAVPASGVVITQTHGLGVIPRQMQVWWRASSSATFVMPVQFYDEGNDITNGATVAVSSNELKYLVGNRPISYFHFSGDGSTFETANPAAGSQFRFLLWK